ncbi:MAG TPA: OmpH family outer membrane protein [Chthonomonas sp.]|jgi:Skp family chaperone for outer membrane proteins|uniref:OmpH family outer membrane protein n=1 Tax=Chthonomonas sp. TaxID=2282153 RepID=UPI002B4B039F|nr:OmpH family outer membrane protein [Chthonomonas sp.]HLH81415.1 OmpH family outer membrane protein [Chthonomonas sp.]
MRSNDSRPMLYWIVLAAIVWGIVASLSHAFADAKSAPGDIRFASVDMNRIQTEYKLVQQYREQMQAETNQQQQLLQVMTDNPFLSEQDQKTLATLLQKANTPAGLTPAEKQQEQQLLDQSKKANDDYQRLSQAQNLSPQDKQTLDNYLNLEKATEARINLLKQQFQQDMQNKLDAAMAQLTKNIRDAIATVAKDKGYALVLDNSVAPYAQADCTDDVLKILNK